MGSLPVFVITPHIPTKYLVSHTLPSISGLYGHSNILVLHMTSWHLPMMKCVVWCKLSLKCMMYFVIEISSLIGTFQKTLLGVEVFRFLPVKYGCIPQRISKIWAPPPTYFLNPSICVLWPRLSYLVVLIISIWWNLGAFFEDWRNLGAPCQQIEKSRQPQ